MVTLVHALKTHALSTTGATPEDEFFTYHQINSSWTKETLEEAGEDQVKYKLLLSLRVIWYKVTPVPTDSAGKKMPKVFCCLFHKGKWAFFCDFKDFEREFSFKYELKMFEVAS